MCNLIAIERRGYANIADKPDLSVYDEALNYIDNVLPVDLARLQNQIDDAIESWFYHYDPTLSNIPASGWTTNALKEAHLDDTFTNLDSGQSWRFTRSGPAGSYVYSWALLSYSAATKALVLAGQAKDTADGKRRVFVNTPYPPYDVGDLWAQGAAGDIMRCKTARLTGSYVAADWEKASKYIDESKASALATAAASSGMQIARDDLAKRLGYTDYAAMVTAATQGKTIIDGGYIRTALIDAAAIVTETLVAQRLTAAMIEALDITTSQLTVTSGAKIGNFSIYDGWLTSNSAAGEDVGYLDMRSASSRIAFGSNLLPVSSAGGSLSLTGIIQNINKALSGGVTYALDLRAAGDFDSSVKAVALMANGGLNFRGSCSFVEEVAPLNTNISNSSYSTAESLKWYRNFVFQAPSSGYYADIYLPKDAAVEATFGYFTTGRAVVDAGVIRIYLICTRWSSGYYRVKSDSSTPIIKHTGDTMDYVQINAGDCCTFTYLNRSWYYSASNWE